jgi:hypothetical protein
MKEFLWIPGNGFDEAALNRMQKHFVRPSRPMGEAWFMGSERYMFDYLCGDLKQVPTNELIRPLEEIASGMRSFGFNEEWSVWFHYLLGQTIPRSHDRYVDYLLNSLITAFITQYPEGVKEEPYKGFYEDAMNTLGKCIMDKQYWNNQDIVIGSILWPSNNNPKKIWLWDDASGDFSASMFFCLKYLPSKMIPLWFKSALKIESPHWRAQLIVWLTGAYKILNGEIQHPSELDERPHSPVIGWTGSHLLAGEFTGDWCKGRPPASPFLPEQNRVSMLKTIEEEISEALYFQWLISIEKFDYLESELGEITTQFSKLYVYK